jgi:uncharacterized protein YbjT (DUF2867 family)
MERALAGAETVFLVSAAEDADRIALHRSAVDAAVAAGARHIVYLSFLNAAADSTFTFARDHFLTEEHIRAARVAFTFLRPSLYADYVPLFASPDGVIAGPAGDGRTAWIARDDLAEVATVVLADAAAHAGRTHDITGPEAHTLAWAAERLTEATGRRVVYRAETIDEAYASRAGFGAPRFEVDGWVTSYVAVAEGELDVVTETVPRLTGHPAQTLPEFLAAHPDSVAHLRAA